MPSFRVVPGCVLAVALLAARPVPAARAQAPESRFSEPAHITYVARSATLERDGQAGPLGLNEPVVDGDRLRTAAGRVELLFPGGAILELDEYSTADMLSGSLIRLAAGRAILIVPRTSGPAGRERYQIDTPVASARAEGPGEYRVSIFAAREGEQAEAAVVRGTLTFATERGSIALRAGERSIAFDDGLPAPAQPFNSARMDAFDRWSENRRDSRLRGTSAQYLPDDLRMYAGTLDQYGSWRDDQPYGYVWYPAVAPDWRPYYDGYWSPLRRYGWTWIGVDLWSWPTHHFGRWGYARGLWFWIPGRTWGPAWVSWAAAPGYVSWCPLGYDSRPVFDLATGFGDPWLGWTVIHRDQFGYRGYDVNRYAVGSRDIPRSLPFIQQASSPVAPPARLRAALANPPATGGGVAVRRSGPLLPVESPRGSATDASRRDVRRVAPPGRIDAPRGDSNAGGANMGANMAVRRQGPLGPEVTGDFRRPLPEAFRTPRVDRTIRPGLDAAGPAVSSAGDRDLAVRRYRPAPGGSYQVQPSVPSQRAPQSVTPLPQAVPRWNPPPARPFPDRSPGNDAAPSPPWRPPSAPAYPGAVRRAGPSESGPPPAAYGSGDGGRHRAPADPPAASAQPRQAAPRSGSEGDHERGGGRHR